MPKVAKVSTEIDTVTQNTGKRGRPKGVKNKTPKDDARIVALASRGVQVREIAKICDASENTIQTRLNHFRPIFKELDKAKDYRLTKVELLDAAEYALLKNIVSKIDGASLRDSVYAFDKVSHYGRLAAGLSTANIAKSISYTGPQIEHIRDDD